MSTNANLRRTIQALCAPAVMAMLAGHVPVAEAAVDAKDGQYVYSSPGFSSTTTFSFHVLKNDQGFNSQSEQGPESLVDGAPAPLQLSSARLTNSDGGVTPIVSTFRNCIMVSVSRNASQSGSSGIFSITYTVADAQGSQDSGELTFFASEGNSFNEEPAGSRCDDPSFDGSIARDDNDPAITTTPANTPITIAVLDNDTLGGIFLPTLTAAARSETPTFALAESGASTLSLTADGGPVIRAARTSKNGGTVQVNSQDGTVTYTPPQGFSGQDTFNYTIEDYDPENDPNFNALNSSAAVTVTVGAPAPVNQAVIAFNGMPLADRSELAVPDTDGAAGESVTFDGSQTILNSESPKRFQWFVNDVLQPNATTSSFTAQLGDGASLVTLVVSATGPDNESTISVSSSVNVTVAAPVAQPPGMATIVVNNTTVNNGGSFAIADTDNALGETATFDGSQTVLTGNARPNRFQWFVNGESAQDGASPTFQTKLNDGTTQITLSASANDGEVEFARATSSINVTVAPSATLAAIAVNGTVVTDGGNFSLTDTDAKLGETATFDGSQTRLAGGVQPTRFQWFVNDAMRQDGASATFQVSLPENSTSAVRLIASNGQSTATSLVNVTVALTLANIQNLTPNQRQVAQALDRICTQLVQRLTAQQSLSNDQQDLLNRCQGILAANTNDQVRALDELGAQDFNGARLQTLLFTNSLYAGVMDRLMALRGGVKGLSLAGLDVIIDGKSVPLADLQKMFGKMLGGGAAADGEAGSLLGDKWGAWSRGNFTFGEKDRSRNDKGFEADQFSLTAGLDYRLSDTAVIGGAVAYGSSNLNYNPSNEGGLDTKSWAVSIYGSRYEGKSFYIDGLLNAANSNYEAHRRITYNEAAFDAGGAVIGTNVVQRDARGDTDGLTVSGGLSGGYDFVYKGLTITPNVGVFYVDSTIDKFREGGSGGLNLVYDEQSFQSLTGTFGFRLNYALNLSWGVVLPYFRGDYVREFNKDVEAFNVHFASDPANPAPPIVVQSDSPDQSYVRLVGGISGQFPFGISGYVEYQRLQGFEFVNFNDVAMGLRVQYRY